ncbi:MAG: VWA domain-containing protein [Clostridia bacterium]|nr:VWA domain-containing protein [Clostridia bacterium]
MTNFQINFTYPWLLLAFIPAIIVALVPYFRLNKKYRRTRNRITSLVLHIIVTILATLVLSGLNFTYELPKEGNQIILLVDMSESEERAYYDDLGTIKSADTRDELVRTALEMCEANGMSVGVVTFGFNQVYATPFTKNAKSGFESYLAAQLPDTSATDLAAAIEYARTLFDNPDTSKIVVVSDGKQTDGDARRAIDNALKQNTKIDFVDLKSYFIGNDLQVVGVTYPDYHVKTEEECVLKADVYCNTYGGSAMLSMFDNDSLIEEKLINYLPGLNTYEFTHSFANEGLHAIKLKLSGGGADEDDIQLNNGYTSYYELQNFDKVLVLEGISGYSQNLETFLGEKYELTIVDLHNPLDENIPRSVDDLRKYDQVILNNVSNADMDPEKNPAVVMDNEKGDDLVAMISEYVSEYGGGLLTLGGSEPGKLDEWNNPVAHAYNRNDMNNTEYQRMLPVQSTVYKPSSGIVFVVDISGSMGGSEGETKLTHAVNGIDACLKQLEEKDYVGLVTLFQDSNADHEVVLPMTSVTQYGKIREAVYEIEEQGTNGGTIFSGAIQAAAEMLNGEKRVERKHIILVTDGLPAGSDVEKYERVVKYYYDADKTTISVIMIGSSASAEEAMIRLVDICKEDDEEHGKGKFYPIDASTPEQVARSLREDLKIDALHEVNLTTYYPTVKQLTSPLVTDLERTEKSRDQLNVTLDGFYGVKARKDAQLVLTGDYDVPLYAYWKYGKGTVGSFMADLNREFSDDFMNSNIGQQLMYNIVESLMPIESIRPIEINLSYDQQNYTNVINVYETLDSGEKMRGRVEVLDAAGQPVSSYSLDEATQGDVNSMDVYVRKPFAANNNAYSNCDFVIKTAGIYLITIEKTDADGNVLKTFKTYKSFAYSLEYDLSVAEGDLDAASDVATLATMSGGAVIQDVYNPIEMFNDFVLTIASGFDPRYLNMILAIVLFLIDIIVRKFKFKWPHEWFKKQDEKAKK